MNFLKRKSTIYKQNNNYNQMLNDTPSSFQSSQNAKSPSTILSFNNNKNISQNSMNPSPKHVKNPSSSMKTYSDSNNIDDDQRKQKNEKKNDTIYIPNDKQMEIWGWIRNNKTNYLSGKIDERVRNNNFMNVGNNTWVKRFFVFDNYGITMIKLEKSGLPSTSIFDKKNISFDNNLEIGDIYQQKTFSLLQKQTVKGYYCFKVFVGANDVDKDILMMMKNQKCPSQEQLQSPPSSPQRKERRKELIKFGSTSEKQVILFRNEFLQMMR